MHLKSIDGKIEKEIGLNDQAMKFVKHAWASTNHATQGKSVKGVIVAMTAHEKMTDQQSFYTAISRFKQKVLFFTDDREQLEHTLTIRTAEPKHSLSKAEILEIASDVKKEDEKQKAMAIQRENEKARTREYGMSIYLSACNASFLIFMHQYASFQKRTISANLCNKFN